MTITEERAPAEQSPVQDHLRTVTLNVPPQEVITRDNVTVRVNAVAPGPYWTPLQVTGGQPPSQIPQFGAQSPMKRPGQPAELAGVYVLLASQESSYATGQVYGAAGGSGNP